VVDSTDEAFISIDGDGLITAWSRRAEELFGWTAEAVIGSSLADTLIPPAQRAAHLRGLARHTPESTSKVVGQRIELTALHRDGHELPVELGVWAHEDGAGFSGFVHDISDRVKFQAELEAARDASLQASRHKSEFLATMSHEIRTPMNAVIGMTGLLLDTALDEQQREFTETVRDSGEALLGVINDILDFSKIEAGEVELEVHPFELRECVESALALVAFTAGAKGLELVADLDERCPDLVTGDVTRFRQVLVNLFSNAVKFTERGEVVVTVRAERLDDADDGGVHLTVAVRDTGIGIPADRTDRLFRPFSQVDSSTTRTHGGTGLGLVISRRLAEAMGGGLEVESEVGVGSTFTFDAVLAVSTDRRPPTSAGASELMGKSALIVDDNATNRRVLEVVLRSWGMSCTQAATPAAALALLSAGRQVDVAVLDMHMPDMDGQELARAVRRLPTGRDLPLILLTSLQSRPVLADRSLFAATLTKPARSSLLCEKLLEALAPSRAAMHAVETAGGRRTGDGPAVGPSLRVLLAEDNPVNQKVAQLVLAKLGYRVDSVSNGLEALEAVRSGGYDVVLMDVQMPVLDGIEATRAIRAGLAPERQPHIIAMTASVLIEDEAACLEAGMDSYLTKPIRPQELGEALGRITRQTAGVGRPTE
jgi:PAS domain S-box-containing protein